MKGRVQRLEARDHDTGKLYGVYVVPLDQGIGRRWVRVFQDARREILKADLPKEALRVMMYLEGEADYQNHIPRQSEVAEALGMSPSHVSRAYKALFEAGVLVKEDGEYSLSPLAYWKGRQSDYTNALRSFGRPQILESRAKYRIKPPTRP